MKKIQEMESGKVTLVERRYLVSGLPNGHLPSEHHLQVFDNFPHDTNIRLRKERDPATDSRLYSLTKAFLDAAKPFERNLVQISLSNSEWNQMAGLRGREVRFNRYSLENKDHDLIFDIYLGRLIGLNIATLRPASPKEIDTMREPEQSVFEISDDDFFTGPNIVDLEFTDIRDHLATKKGGAGDTSS